MMEKAPLDDGRISLAPTSVRDGLKRTSSVSAADALRVIMRQNPFPHGSDDIILTGEA